MLLFHEPYPETLILEIGADRPGDIKSIMSYITPDISVITRFGELPVHIEFFNNRTALIDEDAEIVKALSPKGVFITNADDNDALALRERTKARTLTYGIDNSANLSASNIQMLYSESGIIEGITFKVNYDGKSFPMRLYDVIGRGHVYSVLPAILQARRADHTIAQGAALGERPKIFSKAPKGRGNTPPRRKMRGHDLWRRTVPPTDYVAPSGLLVSLSCLPRPAAAFSRLGLGYRISAPAGLIHSVRSRRGLLDDFDLLRRQLVQLVDQLINLPVLRRNLPLQGGFGEVGFGGKKLVG